MRGKTLSIGLKTALASFTAICALAIFTSALFVTEASAGTLKVLHSFNGADGQEPVGVVLDASGNLYGVADRGGIRGFGLAFELTPTASGHWDEKALIQFNKTTGMYPSPIVFDSVGNLYGMLQKTASGGTGAVFELSPTTDGQWDEKILHVMENNEGNGFFVSVTLGASGNIFGTASGGGKHGGGTVFELSPTTDGGWQETTLESFTLKDGAYPRSSVVSDAAGNLYGTTSLGGDFNAGTVFELSPNLDGTWTETVVYSFTGKTDGYEPSSSVIFDAAGNLYGTTFLGGASEKGTVFELAPSPGGTWTETVLHSFRGGLDGSNPNLSTLTFDKAGNLFGETVAGGNDRCSFGCGVVFELSPIGGGSWAESFPYRFKGTDGSSPSRGLVFDAAGNLYGTTLLGGAFGDGVVFELKP
jgi:uncharacterized repeat protein (TIGR03803 family)